MGEGWLLPGEAAELIEKGYSNIICAQPFGCLPNHIVGKGTVRRLRELYKDANIFPIDYDAGASKVNQENRIKLMLSMAKENSEKSSLTHKTREAVSTDRKKPASDRHSGRAAIPSREKSNAEIKQNAKQKQAVKAGEAK